ncbi:hypothetical protein BKA93DRAFT_621293 [Sparassis latifolia]|uniref:Uncharacterized protein n=1 Tax=Sparassis crispa TaxID=139825 RepID=A0A401G8A3_9APHY|nr:hypothetical protein SCP_0112630 [Sparassis crispa]GBE78378.1 hypothetical protein SCP_0112630 [Sparassis crispa]
MVHPKRTRRNFSLSLSLSSSSKQAGPCHDKKGRLSKDNEASLISSPPTRTRPPSGSVSSYSSHTPLLAIPTCVAPSEPAVPPTTNAFAPSDKMKFMRKVRKLSRVLGEVPVAVGIDESFSESDTHIETISEDPVSSKSNSPLPSPTKLGFPSRQSLKRSATLGHLPTLDTPGTLTVRATSVQRIRSMASMRPSLAIPTAVSHPKHSPLSPIVFSLPDGSHSESSSPLYSESLAPSVVLDIEIETPIVDIPTAAHVRDSSPRPCKSRRNSTASSVLVPGSEQLQPTRAAKLTRHLGDSVPPDVLLRAASPAPRPPSPSSATPTPPVSALPTVSPILDSNALPCRTTSLRRGKGSGRTDAKRRLSLDLRAFADMVVPAPLRSPGSPGNNSESSRPGRATLKKTRSAWLAANVVQEESELDAQAGDARNSDELGLGEPMSDKQRAMAVKRTRKMVQLFGDTPPATLYQITNTQATASADDIASVVISMTSRSRDSRTTFVSDTMSVAQAHVRDSMSTASEPMSPVPSHRPDALTLHDAIVLPPGPTTAERESPSQSLPPSTDPGASVQSLSLSTISSDPPAQSVNSHTPLTAPARQFQPQSPATPPPFSNLFVWAPPQLPVPTPEERPPSPSHEPSPDFRTRRLRAAKLSRFFGVAPKDLAEALPAMPSYGMGEGSHARRPQTPAYPAEIDLATAMLPPYHIPERTHPEVAHARKLSTTVEVAAEVPKGPFRIGRPGQNVVKEMDMRDVIQQLRKMK